MFDFTGISRCFMERIYAAERRAQETMEQSQRALLRRLVSRGRQTKWGVEHGFDALGSYEAFVASQPVTGYEQLRPWVMRMVGGERDVLWPGICRRFAQSSGTSDGKSKYIPLPDQSLQGCHYAGAAYSLASYLHYHPDSRIFGGKNFILGGSYANELDLPPGVRVGDLSASLIDRINPIVNLFRVPSKSVALMEDWEQKLRALVDASVGKDIRSISGVPSWFLTVLTKIIEQQGATTIHDVWPNLEVFFHGGIAFEPYRGPYSRITDSGRMRYWENYNASEGFFAVQDRPGSCEMALLMNAEVFYEFLPVETGDISGDASGILPAWRVRQGDIYELVITSSNGLWRYRTGDTVKVEGLTPLTVTIAGRTKHFINAFGEEVMVHNTDAAIAAACRDEGIGILNYTVAPVYAGDRSRGHHQWLIEFADFPTDLEAFSRRLDNELQSQNSDYQAKRAGDLFLDCLEVIPAQRGVFDSWLATTGKLGGQRKIPRLSNDRRFIDPLLAMNKDAAQENLRDIN